MNAHTFQPTAGSRSACSVEGCGKTRNVKVHGYVKPSKAAPAQVDTDMTVDELDAAVAEAEIAEEEAVAEARQEMLPEVDAQVDDAEVADALAELEPAAGPAADPVQEAEKPAAKTGGRSVPADTAASFWVGWRVAEAGARRDGSLGAKLDAAKPTQLRYRRVHLTMAEVRELDALAATFEEPGNDGYARRAAKTLRIEIAKVTGQA